jgi:hypothetical protein
MRDRDYFALWARFIHLVPTPRSSPRPTVQPTRVRGVRRCSSSFLSAGMLLALAPLAKGEQALALAFEFDPKAVLLDIGMPGINGLEVARELRRRMGAGVRLIAVTGWGQAQDRELAPWQRTTSSER